MICLNKISIYHITIMNQTRDGSIEIYINSAVDKVNVNDTLSSWTSYLPIPVEIENNQTYGLSVKTASICNTIPQFHDEEKTFKIGTTELTIDDDIIFANTASLCAYLNNLMTAQSILLSFALDPKTLRIRLTNNSSGTIDIPLNEPYLSFWKKLGFRYDLIQNLPNVTIEAGGDILFQYIATLVPTQRVFIVCDEVIQNSAYPSNFNRPIIGSIDLISGYGAYNYVVEPFLYEHDLKLRHAFNSMSFSILDDKYRPVKMRGGSVNLSLVVRRTR